MKQETKTVLVTVKAYPNPSKKYVETVCCAGIDLDTHRWIRLYPVPYRDLESPKKFEKYTIIRVSCRKSTDDHRIESYEVDADSIEIIEWLSAKQNWAGRKRIVLPTVSPSFCQILQDTADNKSLGTFKPTAVQFSWQKKDLEDQAKRQACYAQLSFFDKKKQTIEQIPFDFYYHFRCHGLDTCPGHKLLIVDWELVQSYRSWRYKYKPPSLLMSKIKEKWLDRMCSKKNDVHFYVGNMQRFRDQFLILGVFYPKK